MTGLRDEEVAAVTRGPQEYLNRKRAGFRFVARHARASFEAN